MAKNTYKSNTFKQAKKKGKSKKPSGLKLSFFYDKRFQLASGFLFFILSLYLLTAFLSYLFTGKADQSVVEAVGETGLVQSGLEAENWLGLYGAVVSHYFIFRWFGLAAFFTPFLFFLFGVNERTTFPGFSPTRH